MSQGIGDELLGIDLADERLNKRGRKVIEALAANPEASVNAAMSGWCDTQAAYRFFSNERVTLEQILEPHRRATIERMREHDVVLVVQDTTELDSTDRNRSHPGIAQGGTEQSIPVSPWFLTVLVNRFLR